MGPEWCYERHEREGRQAPGASAEGAGDISNTSNFFHEGITRLKQADHTEVFRTDACLGGRGVLPTDMFYSPT